MHRHLLAGVVLLLLAGLAAAPAQAHHKPGHLHGVTSTSAASMTTTETTLPTTTSVTIGTSVQPWGPGGNWTMVFEDTFSGATLDPSIWAVTDGWTTLHNMTTRAANVTVSGGVLTLQLGSDTEGAHVVSDPGEIGNPGPGYHAPLGSFVEARVWFGGGGAVVYNWSGWWTSGPDWAANGEHDITEVLSGDLTTNYWRNVPQGLSGTPTPIGSVTPPGTWHSAWHTYGLHRKAASADVYWDGQLVRSYTTSDLGGPHVLLFTVGKHASGTTNMVGPAGAMQVDYVRVWTPA